MTEKGRRLIILMNLR